MKNPTDIELIQQVLKGDTQAFGEIIKRYQSIIYAIALRYVGNFADAQDVAQESFIEAYKSLSKLSDLSNFSSWLHSITLHQCNRWKRRKKEETSLEELNETQVAIISNNGTSMPDDELEKEETYQIVLKAISSLPEKIGETVVMYYIDGLSYSEIAKFLSVPISTIKGRLQMGRKQLKEELIAMVDEVLKENKPDERWTEKVLKEIIEQTKSAQERGSHDEVIMFCEKALEVLDHLDITEEHERTKIDILSWQSREWLRHLGKYKESANNYHRAAQIADDLGDHSLQAKWLLMQAVAFSNMGNFQEMRKPLQSAHTIYSKLGNIEGQIACDAILGFADFISRNTTERLQRLSESNPEAAIVEYEKMTLIQPGNSQWYKAIGDLYRKPKLGKLISDNVLSFDGNRSYLEIYDNDALDNLDSQVTMEAWIFPTSYRSPWTPLFFKGDNFAPRLSNRSYTLWVNHGGYLQLGSSPTDEGQIFLESPSLIKLNSWNHVAGVIDAKSKVMKILINGNEVASRDFGDNIRLSRLPLRIGWTHEERSTESLEYNSFAGQIAEIRIWDTALKQQDIQATMDEKLLGNEPNLIAHWRFDSVLLKGRVLYGLFPQSNSWKFDEGKGRLVGNAKIISCERPIFSRPNSDVLAKAVEAYSKAFDLSPGSYDLCILLTQTYLQLDKKSDAERVYRKALENISDEIQKQLIQKRLDEICNDH